MNTNENKNVLPIKMIPTVDRNDFQQLLVYSIQSKGVLWTYIILLARQLSTFLSILGK